VFDSQEFKVIRIDAEGRQLPDIDFATGLSFEAVCKEISDK